MQKEMLNAKNCTQKITADEKENQTGSKGFILVEPVKKNIQKKAITIDRSKIPPYYVFITWDIHYACNYDCTYCNTPKPYQPLDMWEFRSRKEVAYPGISRLLEIWNDIYNLYGSCEIHITGGEPFVYPDFIKLMTELAKVHTLEIITNLSVDVSKIINNVAPDRVRIGTTFHPEFADLDEFIAKHKELGKHGFETWANYVLYPPIIKDASGYKAKFDKLGIPLNLQPMLGFHNGKEYPMAYTDEEIAGLKECYGDDDIVNRKTIEWKTAQPKRDMRGRKCRMGQMYAKVYPNGNAYACCAKGAPYIGNLFDGTFELTNEPEECTAEHCHCWRCMLVDREDNWKQHWVIPHKT
jgi:MoaA/NifB/PqqE/SkfB family radical SAM enzyme